MEAIEHCGNRRPRVERLVSAWNQGSCGDADPAGEADDPLIGESAEPKKRPRTRLTDEEVDAMRTARAQGISVNALARRFGVHRARCGRRRGDEPNDGEGVELTSTPSRRESGQDVLPHRINDLWHMTCG